MEFTGERMVIGQTDIELEIEHVNRYRFASQFTDGKDVLDAACGTGYGSALMARNAKAVNGIDISQEAVDYATDRFGNTNINFIVSSVDTLPFNNSTFDVVVSFETIEHVNEKIQNNFLKEVKRVIKHNGVFVVSTPNHSVYKEKCENHFHVKELEYSEFKFLLESKFKNVKFYSQIFEVSNAIVCSGDSLGNVVSGLDPSNSEYLVAVCSDSEIKDIKSEVFVRKDNKFNNLMKWAVDNHNTNERNNAIIAKNSHEIENLNTEVESKNVEIEQFFKNKIELRNEIQNLENLLEEIKLKSEKNEAEIEKYEAEIERYEAEIERYEAEIERYEAEIEIYKTEVEKYNEERYILKQDIDIKNTMLNNKEGHIELLLEREREFERLQNSRAWKIMSLIWKTSSVILPQKSKRRLAIKVAVKGVKHPIVFAKKLNPKRVGLFFYYLRREGVSGVSRRLDECLIGPHMQKQEIVVAQIENVSSKTKADYLKLTVPQFEVVEVSIIIPVYNQFEYTYNCIKSIIENSGDIKYEIIIGDDCSSDLTKNIEEIITGINVIKNEENLRFLRNCNNAAKFAKGEYILFLNNDTQVQSNWLEPLVELIERDDKIGMVGSKLIYPDGRLQEAGGIFWNDASAWNYGNLSDPNDPEYNYVKEVDYISGAAIMIKSFLWNEIGGFDEIFVPAYYEDSDLAFEVRKHGYKVMYQPLSVVVHFEGISNGTDVNEGQKAYQITNQKKFYEKWKDVLEKEHCSNGENVFVAKDRSRFKKHMLVVDHYVPNHDKDAGGKCTFMYIKLFVSMGMKVTFIGDNFFKHEPYTTELNQMGVEVLYGNYYFNNWKKWLRENGNYFDFAYLNRPHIAEKYIDIMRQFSEAKIIYFGHDLHYLREYRQYEIQGDPELLKSSNRWKEKEFELFNKADIIYTVGNYEQEIIKKEFQQKPVKNIPVYIYEGLKEYVNTNFKERKDIMFVGGFGHPPNVDAVLWFAREIFPKVLNKYPDLKWYIAGSKPPENILKLACDHIIVTGFIPDDELEKLYDSCRMAVVPLRVGAGVKGKVVEAVYNRIPLVTTPIGAEGLSLSENAFVITEGSDEMTDAIINLYEDFYELEKVSDNCKLFIENHFTDKTAKRVVLEDIVL